MAKIVCRAIDCIFWDDGLCSSDKITYDPEEGCLTYEVIDDLLDDEEDWEDEEEELDALVDDDEDLNFPYDDEEIEDDFDDFDDDIDDDW
jgi:hypothetical protein